MIAAVAATLTACLTLSACHEPQRDSRDHPVVRPTIAVDFAATGDRIRYDPRHRPVLVTPDGARREVASMLVLSGRMAFGHYAWHDLPAADAPVWIRVDLARQLLSVFRGGDEIGTAVIIYGTDGRDTPTGVFPIRGKERLHKSRAYDADMPFTLWLTDDGVAIHASTIERGRATHGCIGIPAAFAEKLFAVAQQGDTVVVAPARSAT